MSYHQDRKAKQRKLFLSVGFLFLLIIFIFFRAPIYRGFSTAINFIFRPIMGAGNSVGGGFSSIGSGFKFKRSLVAENDNLKQELSEMNARLVNYDSVVAENESLKEILGRKNPNSNMLLSAILSKAPKSAYDTMLIDVGVNNGLVGGETVFAKGDIPLGRIAEVFASSSKVILFTTPGEVTNGVVSGNGLHVELIGRGGGNFEIVLPRDFVFEKGMQVTLPGVTPYVIAMAETIISDPRDAFQKILLTSPVNVQELKFVEIQR